MKFLVSTIICGLGLIITFNITKDISFAFLSGWLSCCVVDIIFVIIEMIKENN
jgi:hypothetical protein